VNLRTAASVRLAAAPRLARVPVASFAIVAGLCSFTMAFRELERVLGFGGPAAGGLALLAAIGFLVIASLYLGKMLASWADVRAEFADPVTMPFFPTLTISLLLLPLVISPYQPALALPLWLVAAAAHLVLMVAMVRRWIVGTFRAGTFSPVWFLSVGGNLVAAMTGVQLGFVELAWFFLSTGLVTCGAMFAIAMYRFIFHDRFPVMLAPSLFILMTPPSAGFLAYMQLGDGQLDVLARTLFFSALFVAGILASLTPVFMRVEFSLGWWTCTFPSAALTMAVLRYHEIVSSGSSLVLLLVILTAAVLLFLAICLRTAGWLLGLFLVSPRAECDVGNGSCSAHESITAGIRE
jgi:tellurite resistance protein